MNSQIKERIVGAVVLVAFGVWVIPLILDGRQDAEPAASTETELTLPPAVGEVAPVRTEIVELAPTRPVANSAASLQSADDSVATDDQQPRTAAVEQAAAEAGDAADSRDDVAPVAGAGAPGATAAATPPAPVTRPPAPTVEAAKPAPGGWAVQLGAFSEVASANQLAARVRDVGFPAEVSDVQSSGRTLHRVRVEGFATRELAEVARSALSAHNFVAQVRPPE